MSHDPQPLGGKIISKPVMIFGPLIVICMLLIVKRLVFGLGSVSDLNGGFPWGVWIAFDLLIGTGFACGGWALAWAVYVFNRGQYHPLVRPALLASLFGYSLGGLSITIDVGRYWNLPYFYIPGHFNVNSVLFETAVCMTIYIGVMALEFAPALFERLGWKVSLQRLNKVMSGYLRTLTDGQLLAIKTLSMDMNAGYIRAARIHLPCAVEKIAFDRFHVAKQLGEVVDKTRQNEHPHLPVESWRQAKGTRFLWQYSDKWMTKSRQEKLIWLRAQMKLTSQCWALKELAKDIWNRPWSEERRNDWERWLALAANSDVPMMKNAAKTIGKRLYGILNAMRHRVSNGNAEALNSKIRLLRIKARGYRNRERFKLGVMFHYGKLNMAF
ncbi:TPA: Ni/Fe-hydrogenase cytochrome b subunit [Escherichia coli]|nr:Ni/Fe-hydrogenase cytochrome b subunit [Escherichia coli]HAJ7919129.1 Ni/Fe-hydrogenase cytochrome b subunit [Escherichia coli]